MQSQAPELADAGRRILDTNGYLTLVTVDPDGRPRPTPVYFSPHQYASLYWISKPEARHSQNLAADDRVRAVIFDSSVPACTAAAVTATGRAGEVPGNELADHTPIAFRPFEGTRSLTPDELRGNNPFRLYVFQVESWELTICSAHPTLGTGSDRWMPVVL